MYIRQQETLRAEITTLQQTIADTQAQLAALQTQLANTLAEKESTQLLFEQRLDAMYRTAADNEMETLLGARTFAELLRTANDLQQIALAYTKMLETLRAQQQALQQQVNEEQQLADTLAAQKAQLDESAAALEQSIRDADAAVTAAAARQQAYEAAYAENDAALAQAYKEWQQWAGISNADNDLYTGGEFIWPVPGATHGSRFGEIRGGVGDATPHRGIDIPAATGVKIYAAAGGVVSTRLHASYGTALKISISKTTVTIYGHMSAYAAGISDGVTVQKGDLIGYVGNTGNSYGSHLHFEVDIYGKPTSPWPYFGV